MPLNKAERKMKKDLVETYGKGRGESMFYALEAQGKTPSGGDKPSKMAKGGLVMSNCGASTKPNRKARK